MTGEDGPLRFWIEVDDDVQIRIARAAIQGKVGDDDDDKAGAAPSSADDDAESADSDSTADVSRCAVVSGLR